MLSLEEAERFAVEVLKVPYRAGRVKNDSLSLLNEMIRAFHATIPFQDLTLISTPPKERRMPTIEQIKEDVLSGRGGLCYALNTFMKYFLEALGYAAHHVASSVSVRNDHIMTVVDIKGGYFIVDVGSGYPTFEAVPISFEQETEVYMHSFLKYKFTKTAGDVIRLHHVSSHKNRSIKEKPVVNGWWEFYRVDLTPRSLDFFIESMTMVYTTGGVTPFHHSLRMAVFPDMNIFGFNDKKHRVGEKSEELTTDEVIQAVSTHFPIFTETVKAAIVNLGWD